MFCAKCRKDLGECTCSDIYERLDSLRDNPHIVFRMCKKCGEHYSRCECDEPEWVSSNKDTPLPESIED